MVSMGCVSDVVSHFVFSFSIRLCGGSSGTVSDQRFGAGTPREDVHKVIMNYIIIEIKLK